MKTHPGDVSNNEILQEIRNLSGRFVGLENGQQVLIQRVDGLEGRFDGLEGRFDGLEGRFDGLEGRFDGLENGQNGLQTRMETLESSQGDLLEAVHVFSEHVDERFDRLEGRVGNMERDMTHVNGTISGMKTEMVTKGDLQSELGKLQTRMVTKDYLDEKLAVHHSDLVLRMQTEDRKTLELARNK